MLADFSVTGYIASNIVKNSTKSAQPSVLSLPPRNGVVLRHLLGPNMEGVGKGRLLFEPVVNGTFRFSETNTNRFMHRGS
jgi:hypothetical protein